MDNNFHKFNGNIPEEDGKKLEEQYKKRKIKKRLALIFMLLLLCFFSSYMVFKYIISPSYGPSTNVSENKVYNNTKALSDNMKIVLKVDGTIAKEENLASFKDERDISVDVSEQFLIDYLNSEGYTLENLSNEKIVLNKDTAEVALEPNKYYIGQKDGCLAIYKTDENGNAFIESEDDIYTGRGSLESLPVQDQKEIKDFKYGYDTKNEAKEIISGYIS